MVKDYILSSKVFHKRHHPKENSFNYRSYFVVLDMLKETKKHRLFGINKFNIFSFFDKDHGIRKNVKSVNWAIETIKKEHIDFDDIKLITMPRVFGYLFNPVSFWVFIKDKTNVAIIAEVNNTFGETHSYICHNNGHAIIQKCHFQAEKVFHVSPFYQRQGYYDFNFNLDFKTNARNTIKINYYDDNQLQLVTAINCSSLDLI